MKTYEARPVDTGAPQRRSYRSASRVDPRIEARHSPISGTGLFARAPIARGEIVVVWGGTVMTAAEVRAGRARERSLAMIGESLYIGSAPDAPDNLDEFMNHACDPNVWMIDEVTLVARRDIAPGEEVTTDYGLWETDLSWEMPCGCGSTLCRGIITGRDWERRELQERYRGHFSPYIALRISSREAAVSRRAAGETTTPL